MRQCEIVYLLQKKIEKKVDGILVKARDFQYHLPKILIDSISHAKDSHRINLQVFITRLTQSLHKDIVLLGKHKKMVEKAIVITISGVKKL